MKHAKPGHVIESDLNSRGILLLRMAALSLVIVLASLWWLSRMTELEMHDSIVQILSPVGNL